LAAAAFVVKLVALVVQVQVLLVLMVSLGVLAQRVLAALAIQAEVAAALVDILRSAAMAQMELLAARLWCCGRCSHYLARYNALIPIDKHREPINA
jgi:hypothetical protein